MFSGQRSAVSGQRSAVSLRRAQSVGRSRQAGLGLFNRSDVSVSFCAERAVGHNPWAETIVFVPRRGYSTQPRVEWR